MQGEKGEKVSLGEVVVLDEAKKALEEAIELPIIHPELIKKYGVGGVRGILLFGPPGTGKTMLINATANKLPDVRVLTLSGYDVTRRGPDAVVASIREIFDRAKEHPPAIVFIDEIDAVGRSCSSRT